MIPLGTPDARTLLGIWVSILGSSQNPRLAATIVELVVGSMLSKRGHITQALLSIVPGRCWQAYFWAIERGGFRLLALIRAICAVAGHGHPGGRRYFALDDTFIPRASKKAPDSVVTHMHTRKPNQPEFMLGQTIVCLGLVAASSDGGFERAVPLAAGFGLRPEHHGKLGRAAVLLRSVAGAFEGAKTLLVDSWYMKAHLVSAAIRLGFDVVGNVRSDAALYGHAPPPTGKRGRPRNKGRRIDPPALHRVTMKGVLPLYGGKRVRFRSARCLAGFPGLREVRAVWLELADPKAPERWSKPRLLLSTDPSLDPVSVVLAYAKRWTIEELFSVMKNGEGMVDLWMRTRRAYLRWLHVLFAGCAVSQMLALRCGPEILAGLPGMGWRRGLRATAGLAKSTLPRLFGDLRIRGHWDGRRRKFDVPRPEIEPVSSEAA